MATRALIVWRENQIAALLGKRARQRLDERLLRQRDFDGIAFAFIAPFIARGQGHFDTRARPWVLGKIGRRLGLAGERRRGRQLKRHFRWFDKRTLGGVSARQHRFGEIRLGAGNAVIVGDTVFQRHRPARVELRRRGERDRRRLVHDRMNIEGGERPAKAAKGERCIATQDQPDFARDFLGGFGGGGRRGRAVLRGAGFVLREPR